MGRKTQRDEELQAKLQQVNLAPVTPSEHEQQQQSASVAIDVKGQAANEDLAQLLEDTAKYIRAAEGFAESKGAYESKESLFQRLDLGDFVILSHRS